MKKTISIVITALFAMPLQAFAGQTTRFSFSNVDVSFHQGHWDISMTVCNRERSGTAGSLDYEFQLHSGSKYWVIGRRSSIAPTEPGQCLEYKNVDVPVNLNKVPRNRTYQIKIDVAERVDGHWITVNKISLNKDWKR